MRERQSIHQRTYRFGIVMITMMILLSSMVYAENGRINLVFANGVMTENNTYEFDVKGYMTDGNDVLGEGMVYIEYPTNVFGECVVDNGKVEVTKTGILSGNDPYLNGKLYQLINITDTYSDVFAVTFGASYYQEQMKACYTAMSTDPEHPSDLFHISMVVTQVASGSIAFPDDIPGLNSLYYDYEYSVFEGGLDISAANLDLSNNVERPDEPGIDPEPVFAGSVDLKAFSTRVKKTNVEISWKTTSESSIASYIIERSDNGGSYETLSEVPVKIFKGKFNSYQVNDNGLVLGTFNYKLTAVDMSGCKKELSTQSVSVANRKHIIIDDGSFALEASYPNPFNPSFVVPFSVNSTQNVKIQLYDLKGKLIQTVADGYFSPGNHKIHVSCDGMVSGVYLLKVNANGQQAIQKMLLTK